MTRTKKVMSRLLLLVAAAAPLGVGPAAWGQAVFGNIFGTVTDASGAAVPNAKVTVLDTAKGTSVSVTSNASGEFTVEHLIPDVYNVKIETGGFKSFQQNGIQVFADQSQKVIAALTVGSAGETVEVNADQVPQLKTDRADVSTTYTAQDIENLPIPDHNFTNLQLLLPGAVQLGWAHAASENPQGSKQIQIDGQAFGGVNYTLDGTDNQDAILGIIVINPNYESMSEAKIATQNFDAEFGKAVASVQTVQTKSGTNQFHGTAFDNRESNANLARDPFTVGPGRTYPSGLKNQFGGSLGGPIWRDHVFAFGDYQGVRQKVGSSGLATVPSLLALQSCTGMTAASNGLPGCDFSQYAAIGHKIFDNSTGTPTVFNNNGGAPNGNNIIPMGRISPQAQQLFKLLLANGKTPNNMSTSNGLGENYQGTGTGIFNSNQWDVRGDATLSQRVHIFGRFSRFTDVLSGASLFGPAGGPGLGIAGFGGTSLGANDSVAAGVDIAVNSKLVTDIRLGYFRYNITTQKNDPTNANLPLLGENVGTAALPVPVNYGTPDINIADVNVTNATGGPANGQNTGAQFGTGLNMNHCNCPLKEKEDQFQIVNNWTKTLGNHEVKFGADLRYARNLRVPSDSDRTGVNNFGNGPTSDGSTANTGLGFATFILGDVTSFNRYTSASASETNAKEFQARDFAYVQDTWRVTPKLTANLGLRYEYYAPERVNGAGNGALLNLDTGYINVAGVGGNSLSMGVGAPKFPLNPRVGLAYQANEKTVIRGGYGRSFDLGVFGSVFGHVVTQNIPVLANQSVSNTGGPTSYAFNLSAPSAAATGFSTTSTQSVATNALYTFTSPAVNANGQIPITAAIPGAGTTIGNGVNVKARPFIERLPTLDAWNAAVQRSLTPTLSVEVSYVGNKGTHTLSDGDGNNTNPNEPAITLPASFTQNGQSLHYDNTAGAIAAFMACTTTTCTNGVPNSGPYANATNNGTLLRRFTNGNRPACGTGACNWTQDITYYGDDQDTHYNAIQAKVTKALTQGFNINLNYAYAHGIDNANNFATWDKQAIIGNDSAVRRSAFTAYGLWRLPFGKGQFFGHDVNGVVNGIIGGWELSPTVVWQSGLPFSLNYSACSSTLPNDAPCQPNGDPKNLVRNLQGVPGAGGVSQFQPVLSPGDIAAGRNLCNASSVFGGFTCPGLGQIGNIRRNSLFGPNFFNGDMSLEKNIAFRERFTAQFRMDAYNVFNHINYGTPNGTIDSGNAGQISQGPYPTSTGGTTNPRQLQFTAHLSF